MKRFLVLTVGEARWIKREIVRLARRWAIDASDLDQDDLDLLRPLIRGIWGGERFREFSEHRYRGQRVMELSDDKAESLKKQTGSGGFMEIPEGWHRTSPGRPKLGQD